MRRDTLARPCIAQHAQHHNRRKQGRAHALIHEQVQILAIHEQHSDSHRLICLVLALLERAQSQTSRVALVACFRVKSRMMIRVVASFQIIQVALHPPSLLRARLAILNLCCHGRLSCCRSRSCAPLSATTSCLSANMDARALRFLGGMNFVVAKE